MSPADDENAPVTLEDELRQLIVEGLVLQEIDPEDIAPEQPLFEDGLGLDSVDALELAMIIQKEYGIKVRGTTEENRERFRSLRSLARFIARRREEDS